MTHADTPPTRAAVRTDLTPAPLSSFSQGVRIGDLVQVSGQGPLDPVSGEVQHVGDIAAQTTLTLMHVESLLRAGGASFADVVMVRVYLTTRDHFAGMNASYERYMAERITDGVPPARTTVMVGLPLEGMLVEIDALARIGSVRQ